MVHVGRFEGMRELALFAGVGGGILGGKMLGWRTVCAVEIEPYPRACLLQRQRDGILEPFPIWDDVCTFDGKPWRGRVDVISGGFPCQDISSAGKGLGIERGERSGLWREYARIIREVRPRYCFVENSPMLTTRGLGIVLGDLAEIGYDAAWRVLSAEDCGAPHRRDRIWIVARDVADSVSAEQRRVKWQGETETDVVDTDADGSWELQQERYLSEQRRRIGDVRPHVADAVHTGMEARPERNGMRHETSDDACEQGVFGRTFDWGWKWWQAEPGLGRVADGVANRVDRLKAIGNGQVSLVAARAFFELYEQLNMKGHT